MSSVDTYYVYIHIYILPHVLTAYVDVSQKMAPTMGIVLHLVKSLWLLFVSLRSKKVNKPVTGGIPALKKIRVSQLGF